MDKVCFNTNVLLLVFLVMISAVFYIIYKFQNNNMQQINVEIPNNVPLKSPIKIKMENNAEYYPEKTYIGERDYNVSSQQVGLVFNDIKTYPLFMNRSGRDFYYHVIDDTRNNIRIPLLNTKKEELYDKDTLVIPELNFTGTVKLYENTGSYYKPFF